MMFKVYSTTPKSYKGGLCFLLVLYDQFFIFARFTTWKVWKKFGHYTFVKQVALTSQPWASQKQQQCVRVCVHQQLFSFSIWILCSFALTGLKLYNINKKNTLSGSFFKHIRQKYSNLVNSEHPENNFTVLYFQQKVTQNIKSL